MPQTIDIEVFLAGAYAVFLLLVALGLELVARQAHHRSKQMCIAGFRYHRHHDVWECPAGQQLRPIATDYARRLVRYRAPAHICNACSIKHLCTESQEGREIEHNPDSWLESEIARFHRGISLALLFLAGLLLVVEMIRHQRPMELLILGGGAAALFALLLGAVVWNFGTWYFGMPSSHSLIGSMLGVSLVLTQSLPLVDRFHQTDYWH